MWRERRRSRRYMRMIIRLLYTKSGDMKYLGHLDLMRFFERAFRRLKLPLSFSGGFNPRPKMNFGGPLSVGVSSTYEVMEVEVDTLPDMNAFIDAFNNLSPEGIKLKDYAFIGKSESLMHALTEMRYTLELPKRQDGTAFDLVQAYEQSQQIILRKKNKRKRWVDKDLKVFIKTLTFKEDLDNSQVFELTTISTENGSAKPKDVISILFKDDQSFVADDVFITRIGLYFTDDQGIIKPLMEL